MLTHEQELRAKDLKACIKARILDHINNTDLFEMETIEIAMACSIDVFDRDGEHQMRELQELHNAGYMDTRLHSHLLK